MLGPVARAPHRRLSAPALGSFALLAGLCAVLALPSPAAAANCANTSVGLTPLNDLGAGLYEGFEGGLYPGGANARPAAHDAAGLALANAIVPLDTLGNPSPSGWIVFISIGMSNTTQEFSVFVDSANADPLKNPRVQVIDCAQGGQSACITDDPSDPYWTTVLTRILNAGARPAQVQVAWIKQACPTSYYLAAPDSFPGGMEILKASVASIVRILKAQYPNVKIAFLASRTYGGYATTNLNPEPWAYESGFAMKWLIEEQIDGVDSLNFDPNAGPVEAPWLSWGPYLWADGLTPRSDGLIWQCEEFREEDGTHPSDLGRAKVASLLKTFCHTDAAATPWYLASPTGAPGGAASAAPRLEASPNPFSRETEIRWALDDGVTWNALRVYDASGRLVWTYGALMIAPQGGAPVTRVLWDGRDTNGHALSAGTYLLRLDTRRGPATHKVTLVR